MSKNFALLRKVGKEQNLFQTSDQAPARVHAIDYERPPDQEVNHQQVERHDPELQNRASQIRRSDVIREKIGSVGHAIRKKATHQTDLETIRYREEMKLVQRIFPVNSPGSPQLVIFSSVGSEADACPIAARSAEILAARADGPVCVVDANLRSPFLHRYFGVENRIGLSNALVESGPAQDFALHLAKSNLWLIPGGSASVQLSFLEVLERLGSRMMDLRTVFKYIVINSPLYLDRAPASQALSGDGIVLVVEANSTRRDAVRETMEELRITGTRVLGVVLNNRTFPIPDAIYRKV